ncbi:hypothetical protein BGZ74_007630 [Mortierella antarctica]|nr:hypothetical protein BGZ74_007630 [Mortierella antarctica]
MPSRSNTGGGGGNGGLPFFNAGPSFSGGLGTRITQFTRTVLPRSCLSPRIFLSCIMVTFTVSWLLMFSYSRVSFGFRNAKDSEEWLQLENHFQTNTRTQPWHWGNATLTSHFNCQSPSRDTPSQRPGYDRETMCTVQNLCVDAERGVWIHPSKGTVTDFPWVNVVAGGPGSDSYFRPSVLDDFPAGINYRYIDQTVFIYGQDLKASPSSFSNNNDDVSSPSLTTDPWIMNSLLPLHSIMSSHGGSRSSWFLRVEGQENAMNKDQEHQEIDTSLLTPLGREIVMNARSELSGHQVQPPSKAYPTCFAKAVIGLQSRCTRPHCQNLVGGSELTESLRRTLLGELAAPMIRFQKIDPDIVHPVTGTNIPVVRPDNLTILEGESAPRSRIQVALLGRFGNTSVPNAITLEMSLLARGFAVKTIHLDQPDDIPVAQAAQLFRNQSILVAPQGEGLGYSTWMAPGTTVISILPRFTRSSNVYTDRMMAFGKRFFAWDCEDETCVQPDRDLAHECIEQTEGSDRESITAHDFENFVQMKVDFRDRSTVWKKIADCYAKDVSRRIQVEELTTLIESLAADFGRPDQAAPVSKRNEDSPLKLSKRGAEGDESEEEDQEEGQELDAIEKQEDIDAAEDEDDKDGEVRIQQAGGKGKIQDNVQPEPESQPSAEEEEDINVHEYDTKAPEEEEEEDHSISPTSLPSNEHAAAPLLNTPAGVVGSPAANSKSWVDVPRTQDAVPILAFPEFCRQGRCCGAAKGSPIETIGTSKALTPCAASMSTVVLGPKGVWGQSELSVDARSLVWQVDLGRKP